MKLTDLPPEVLKEILNGPHSYLVLELWKTGDRRLMSTLVNKGVTDIDLRDPLSNTTSRWPACLQHFKLERFSFELDYSTAIPTEYLRYELQQLHGGLKHLLIIARNALEAILPPPESPTSSAANDEAPLASKRTKTRDSDNDTKHQTLWDLNHTWPSLEHLEIANERRFYPGRPAPHYGARMLTLLPRSLTFLGLHSSQLHPVLELMPPNLASLRLAEHSLSPQDLYQLPKTITDLHCSVSLDGMLLLNQERTLLPQLKSFPQFTSWRPIPPSFLTHIFDGTLTWLDTITELTCPMPDSAHFEQLPRNLTSLCVSETGHMLQSRSIAQLPRGLTTLLNASIEWSGIIDASIWPPTLATLAVSPVRFDINCFRKLPRRLCALLATGLHQPFSPSPFDFNALCDYGRHSLAIDPLWPSIKNEILTHQRATVPLEALESYVKSIESGRLLGLPLTLTSLQLPPLLVPTTAKLLLPPRVTDVNHSQRFDTIGGYGHLWILLLEALPPTSCANFNIQLLHDIQPKSPATVLRPTSETLFASQLSSLKISAEFPLTENFFMSLPRTLAYLALNHQGHIHRAVIPEHLQHLPPNLKRLEVYTPLLANLLAPWVHYLPRTLEHMATPSMAIVGHQIKELPPNLSYLYCSFFEVSLPQVLDLPPTLKKLSVQRSGGYETTPLSHCLIDKAWKTLSDVFRPFWRVREAGIHGMMLELTIASKEWRLKAKDRHIGTTKFAKAMLHPAPKRTKPKPNDDNIDYTSANLPKSTKSKDKNVFVDLRTVRRISGYK